MADDPTEGDAGPRKRARPAPPNVRAQLAALDVDQLAELRARVRAQLAALGVSTRDPLRGIERAAQPRPKRKRVRLVGRVQLCGARPFGKVVEE